MTDLIKNLTAEKAKIEAEIKAHKDAVFVLTAKSKQLDKAIKALESPDVTEKDVLGQ